MIDWERVAELKSEVGEEDFHEVIEMFFEEVEEVIEQLSEDNAEKLAEDMHFLKGSALNVGMAKVSALCRDAEAHLRAGRTQDVEIVGIKSAFIETKQAFHTSVDG